MSIKKDFLVSLRLTVVAGFLMMGLLQSKGHAGWTWIAQANKVNVVNSILYASTTNGVYRSQDNGTTWRLLTGLGSFNNLDGNGAKLFAINGQNGSDTLFSSLDNGITWSPDSSMRSKSLLSFSVKNSKILSFDTWSRAFYSENNGQSWNLLNTGYNAFAFSCYLSVDATTQQPYLFSYGYGGIYCSRDKGFTWNISNYGLYINAVYQTARTIMTMASNGPELFTGLNVVDLNRGIVKDGIFSSKDYGVTWRSLGLKRIVAGIAFSKTTTFAGTDSGVYAAPMDSVNWTDISMPSKPSVTSLVADTGFLYAIAEVHDSLGNLVSSTLYRRLLSEVNALLKQQVPGPQPTVSNNFVIDHFSSQHAVGISFNPGRAERASLRVYSATGKNVATLLDGMTQSGANKFIWDYKNFPSGIYCISLQSENGKGVKKVQVMK